MNKHSIALALIALTFSGCGKSSSPTPQSGPDFFHNVYSTADGSIVIDLRPVTFNNEQSVYVLLPQCDTAGHSYTNSGTASTDLSPGNQQGGVVVEGDGASGIIQFGFIKNTGASSDPCRILSTERYSYRAGDINHLGQLTFTAIAPGKSWDGSVTVLNARF